MAEPVTQNPDDATDDQAQTQTEAEAADDGTTKSTRTRWEHTGTAVALMLTGTACLSIMLYVVRGVAVPIWATATFGLATLAAVAWAFGESALQAAAKAGGKQ